MTSVPIADLLRTYAELNSSKCEELTSPPSALEFMRYVARNRPFVVRKYAEEWDAIRKWDVEYLKNVMRDEKVMVAVTERGNADSPTRNEEGELLFVKPHEEQQPFNEFIDYITTQELSPSSLIGEIRYAQTQNDNLRNEYQALFQDVAPEIDFARIALGEKAEAINLWIGNSKSVTALHKDNYENIYVQVAGSKHFVLLPPVCMPSINEQELEPALYVRDGDRLKIIKEEGDKIPFATWDPDTSSPPSTISSEETGYTHLAAEMTMRVTLEKGDMLYLPALWYHKVSQSCSEEGICCAVNYWHDMEFGGGFWAVNQFIRQVALAEGSSG